LKKDDLLSRIKLKWIKVGINGLTKVLEDEFLVEPQKKISFITARVFKIIRTDLKKYPSHYYKDGNFLRLLDVTEKSLIYIAEEDSFYGTQLTKVFMQVFLEIKKEIDRHPMSLEQFQAWLSQPIQPDKREEWEKNETI